MKEINVLKIEEIQTEVPEQTTFLKMTNLLHQETKNSITEEIQTVVQQTFMTRSFQTWNEIDFIINFLLPNYSLKSI